MTSSTARAALLALFAASAGCGLEKAEGRPWVRHVRIENAKHVDVKDLKNKLAIEETSFLHFPKHYLDPFAIDADRARIEAYYRAHGFFGAKVTSAEAQVVTGPKDKPTEVNVDFTVDEGTPTQLAGVQLDGFDPLGKDGAAMIKEAKAKLKPGARFDHELYLEQKGALETKLHKLGYAWGTVEGAVEVNRDTQRAVIKLTAKPGPLAHYGYVHVSGTDRVHAHDLERRANVKRGARFDPDDLEELRGKLYNLGMFSSVRVEYQPAVEDSSIAEIMVTVKEGTFNELRLGGGFGLESQRTDAHLAFSYARRNFRGGLRTLRLRIEPAYVAIPAFWDNQRSGPALLAEATLTQPDWPWPGAQLKWAVGYDVGIEYAYQNHGPRTAVSLSYGFWRQRVLVGLSYNFQYLLFFNTDPTILADPAQAGKVFGYVSPYRLGWWQEDFALDLRDHPLDAHQGFYLGAIVEEGGDYALGAFQYEKLTPDVRGYAPLGGRVTLALRAQFGQIFTQGNLGSPITRRFYLGGPSSHRGFNYNRLSPQVPSGLPGVPPIPVGGDQMVLLQAELRVNVVQIFKQWLSLAAFFDSGDVVSAGQNVSFGNLYHAVGGGLRYKTVIGTVRFDLGVRLNRLTPFEADGTPNADPGQRFAFHLSVGEAF
jgi:outer membrane protein assembly factor BamA